jgi:putative membrane-bound dehydrogenase-like protein
MKYPRSLVLAVLSASALAGGCRSGPPFPPERALETFRLAEGFRIELAASEPAVREPVAMTFDPDGRLFVVEMSDYPMGSETGGRVRLLEDTDGDGRFERSGVFAEGLRFPTSVMPWKEGILVAAAPDVFYLADTDGDGRADERRVVLTGFNPYNPQLRMNGMLYGIDNWIYAAYPKVGPSARHPDQFGRPGEPIHFPGHPEVAAVDASKLGTDVRFRPDLLKLEPASGNSQFGNAFDAHANRFALWNNNHIRHVVIAHEYVARNPFSAVSSAMQFPSDHEDQSVIYPATVDPVFIHDSQVGMFTSACGNSVYTGGIFPERFGSAYFVCEPVHNLVHVDLLEPKGATFVARRAFDEAEFLASTDPWFKPVFTTTGPDGALYVVDYYRKYVEHPDYVPEGMEGKLDLREGEGRGRIYRIASRTSQPFSRPRLKAATSAELVRALSHSNLWWRTTAQRLLVDRRDESAVPALTELARQGSAAEARIHALWTLDGIGRLGPDVLLQSLSDPSAVVREHAVRLADRVDSEAIRERLLGMSDDPDARVQFQLACTLGRLPEAQSFEPLRRIAGRHVEDPWFQIAALSSAAESSTRWLQAVLRDRDFTERESKPGQEFITRIAAIAGARQRDAEIAEVLASVERTPGKDGSLLAAGLKGLAEGVMRGAEKRPQLSAATELGLIRLVDHRSIHVAGAALDLLSASKVSETAPLRAAIGRAAVIARRGEAELEARVRAVRVLALDPTPSSIATLDSVLVPKEPIKVQEAAAAALWRTNDARVPSLVLAKWKIYPSPVRDFILARFFASPDRLTQLLDAVEDGRVEPSTLGRARLTQLTRSRDDVIRKRAQALLRKVLPADRTGVLDRYRPALTLKGNLARGREVFRTNCASCHRIGDLGVDVGPDLVNLAARRSKGFLVADIVDPNANIVAGFEEYLVETTDGRTLSGIIASESATTVRLKRKEGAEDTVLRANIANLRTSAVSAMPEGLEENISVPDMADLLEFLKNVRQRPPPSQSSGH